MTISGWLLLLEALWTTIWISTIAIMLGLVIGLIIALLRVANIPLLNPLLYLYVSLCRATPLVPLTLFLFLYLPELGLDLDIRLIAIIALAINTSSFNAEIWQTGWRFFSKTQHEAALAIGMTPWQIFRRIQFPQITMSCLPAFINEITLLVKSSPAIAVIGVVELSQASYRIGAETYSPLLPLLSACVLYITLMAGLLKLQQITTRHAYRLAN